MNQPFEEVFGTCEAEVVGTFGDAVFRSQSLERYARDDWTAVRRGEPMCFVENDDREPLLHVRTEKRPIFDATGAVVGIAGFINWLAPPVHEVRTDPALAPWLRAAYERIVSGYLEPPVLAVMAGDLGIPAHRLSRGFARAFGRTPKRLLLELRAYAAAYRIETSDAQLVELAADSGFADQSHFNRVFRQVFGIPPGRYRDERSAARGRPTRVTTPSTDRRRRRLGAATTVPAARVQERPRHATAGGGIIGPER